MAELTLTTANFEELVLQADKPVLVDFWAAWCGPCMGLAPVIAELAEEYEGKVIVGKVNVDENMALAQKYQVMSIPNVVLFKNGEVAGRSVGMVPKSKLEELLK